MNICRYAKTDYCFINMPIKNVNKSLNFDDYRMTVMQPFMIYTDFECYNEKIENDINFYNDDKPYKVIKSEQISYSFALYTHSLYDKTKNKLGYYTGSKCLEKFTKYLKKHIDIILKRK